MEFRHGQHFFVFLSIVILELVLGSPVNLMGSSVDSNESEWPATMDEHLNYARKNSSLGILNRKKRIAGGYQVKLGDLPFQLEAITERVTTKSKCGGVLISKWSALTAAHCVIGADPDMFDLFGGKIMTAGDEHDSIQFKVKDIVVHPNYKSTGNDYDIAYIRLMEPVKFNSRINKINLPPASWFSSGESVNLTGQRALASGWGKTVTGNETQFLHSVNLEIISNDECDSYLKTKITDRMICTRDFENGTIKGTCSGDSGGPLILLEDPFKPHLTHHSHPEQTDEQPQQETKEEHVKGPILIGLSNFGRPCNLPLPTGKEHQRIGGFARITHYSNWIQELSRTDKILGESSLIANNIFKQLRRISLALDRVNKVIHN